MTVNPIPEPAGSGRSRRALRLLRVGSGALIAVILLVVGSAGNIVRSAPGTADPFGPEGGLAVLQQAIPAGDAAHGTRRYEDYERAKTCGACHTNIYQQWERAMMSQAYVHHWDEIEYFQLAVPHAEIKPKVAGVKDGCNGCHAPVAFLAGDTPPPRPGAGGLADEAVTCDLCHTIVGYAGGVPHNFNWQSQPGETKQGNREGVVSPYHNIRYNPFLEQAEFCGTCHNEASPWDVWVKSTQIEWSEGPYAKEGVPCQTCHMPPSPGRSAKMGGEVHPDMRQHLFHGAHVESKIKGVVEIVMWPDQDELVPGEPMKLSVALFNQKAGHKVPTGSVEDRQLWLTVEAVDAKGKVYHLPVDPKGFPGEEHNITSNTPAYQDMGEPLGLPGFAGLPRDATPYEGDRIFTKPYFDEQGRRTIMQWNTASQGTDYRIGPKETKIETYTWTLPDDIAIGSITFRATLNFRKLIKSVGDYLKVPEEETATIVWNTGVTQAEVVDW
jgi:hypothetical protein